MKEKSLNNPPPPNMGCILGGPKQKVNFKINFYYKKATKEHPAQLVPNASILSPMPGLIEEKTK